MLLPTEQRRHTQNYLHLQKLGLMTLLLANLRSWFTKGNSSKNFLNRFACLFFWNFMLGHIVKSNLKTLLMSYLKIKVKEYN